MYYESELYHHGIKGQKWGVRRWQNADGTYNEAGKKRYFDAKGEYYTKKRDINRRRSEVNAKYDQKKNDNIYGLDSGGIGQRLKTHIKNEYERSKELNKLDQEALDAKRAYRNDRGKKHTDTLLMKLGQKSINEVANQSINDFTRQYVKNMALEAIKSVQSANQTYQRNKQEAERKAEREYNKQKSERDREMADTLYRMDYMTRSYQNAIDYGKRQQEIKDRYNH